MSNETAEFTPTPVTDLGQLTVGDIIHTTDDSGYDAFLLIVKIAPLTVFDDDGYVTTPAVFGPLFTSWYTVNLPNVKTVPAVSGDSADWVARYLPAISGRMNDEDNPMTWND